MANQEFHSDVGQVIQTTTFTQITQSQNHLTMDERRELNSKIQTLEKSYGKPGKEIWKSLHNVFDTAQVTEMRTHHLKPAHAIIDLYTSMCELEHKLSSDKSAQLIDSLNEKYGEALRYNERLRFILGIVIVVSVITLIFVVFK